MSTYQAARPTPQRSTSRGLESASANQAQGAPDAGLVSSFFGGVASLFAVQPEDQPGGPQAVPQMEEQTESYLPSLDFKSKLAGKSVLLTGATGAVGSEVVRKLLDMPAEQSVRKLVLLVRDRDNLDPQIAQMTNQPQYKGKLHVEVIDLREPQRIEQKFQNIMLRLGGILDTLILCHGVVVQKGLITCTIPIFDQTMLVNVRSVMHLVSLAIPFLKVQPKSSITILTSSQGSKPDPMSPVMSIASSMVQQLIKCAALETAYHGVRVNGVAAGTIISDARTRTQDMIGMKLTPEENKQYLEEAAGDIPLSGQLNAPAEIAETLLFLASDDASFCTGEIMTVDGGQSLTTDNYDEYCARLKSIYPE